MEVLVNQVLHKLQHDGVTVRKHIAFESTAHIANHTHLHQRFNILPLMKSGRCSTSLMSADPRQGTITVLVSVSSVTTCTPEEGSSENHHS